MATTAIARITNALARTGSARPSRMRLAVVDQPEREIVLPEAGAILGSDPACDVVLADPAVSRRHVSVQPVRGGFVVRDLGSRNGTWLDGLAVTELTAPPGTTLRVGRSVVQLLPAEEAVEIAPSEETSFGELSGRSVAMRRIYAVLERASVSDVPVLLLGESGTGKELAARSIVARSRRAREPFVVFDCGAASETLVEGELFGHKRGAFTGAQSDRVGAFARAHKGTLFLDEIGDLPLPMQPKLLRLLERGEVTPLGARKSERYDVRFVAATHRDLWGQVEDGTFRADLYYRLAVVEVHLPALRERREDIPELVRSFLRDRGARDDSIEGPNLDRLVRHDWLGNVRELRNVVARAVALAEPGATLSEMPIQLRPRSASAAQAETTYLADRSYHEAKEELLSRFDREYCTDLMRRAGGNVSEAARIAGLERKYLYRVLERAGVERDRSKSEEAD